MNNDYRQIENSTKEIMGLLYECVFSKSSNFKRCLSEILVLEKRIRKILKNNKIRHLNARSLLLGSLDLSDTGDEVENKKKIERLGSSFLKRVVIAFEKKLDYLVFDVGFIPESIVGMLNSNEKLADWFFFDFMKGSYAKNKKALYEKGKMTTEEYEYFLLTHAHLWLKEQEERAGGFEWN